ncbi:MAG: nitronate monooxygenase [Thermoleophilaceae bacterium]|nr:nitronate monooxygenase [Thermoleophilaceae bacterium]
MVELVPGVSVELPLLQAGMGGGIAGAALAAAVSDAGAIGTIGLLPPERLSAELGCARELTGAPISVNLIVPLAGARHWRIADDADLVVTHWEAQPRRRTSAPWIHTCGSIEEARLAVGAGADGVIAQGVEAGGHVRGTIAALDLLERILAVVPPGFPVLLAGGIAERADVVKGLDVGARAVIAGTRFLACEESGAHPDYKQRLVDGSETVLTELFGMGWPRAPHRVLRNGATERWLGAEAAVPAAIGALHGLLSPIAAYAPQRLQGRLAARAASGPLDLLPFPPTGAMARATLETHPLYAGETVARVSDLPPAGELVGRLRP